jgi:hypothetical protein
MRGFAPGAYRPSNARRPWPSAEPGYRRALRGGSPWAGWLGTSLTGDGGPRAAHALVGHEVGEGEVLAVVRLAARVVVEVRASREPVGESTHIPGSLLTSRRRSSRNFPYWPVKPHLVTALRVFGRPAHRRGGRGGETPELRSPQSSSVGHLHRRSRSRTRRISRARAISPSISRRLRRASARQRAEGARRARSRGAGCGSPPR